MEVAMQALLDKTVHGRPRQQNDTSVRFLSEG